MIIASKPAVSELWSRVERRVEADHARLVFDNALSIVVFGSTAASVARPSSDLDLLIVAEDNRSFKTQRLDVVGVPLAEYESVDWQSGELASHVKTYGIWLKGEPDPISWKVSQRAVDLKARRITSFLAALPRSWDKLDEGFRAKYATKLRRETQRLCLLEGGIAIPPTRFIDEAWSTYFGTSGSVIERLERLSSSNASKAFQDIRNRVVLHFPI